MPVRIAFEKSDDQYVVSLPRQGLLIRRGPDRTLDLLFEALAVIEKKIEEDCRAFYAIDLNGEHKTGDNFLFDSCPFSYDDDGATWARYRDSWLVTVKKLAQPRFHGRVEQWLEKAAQLVRKANSLGGDGLWETNELKFAEIPAFSFAIADRKFVPAYTRLLRLWDCDHEVLQPECIDKIIEKHGICPETEDLLFARVAEQSQVDLLDFFYPVLQEAYGDFLGSSLFHRMVESEYNRRRIDYAAYYKERLEHLKKYPKASPPREFQLLPSAMFEHVKIPGIRDAEERLLCELHAAAAPLLPE
jgi:hypothetical protein